jgi:hypothetical protein
MTKSSRPSITKTPPSFWYPRSSISWWRLFSASGLLTDAPCTRIVRNSGFLLVRNRANYLLSLAALMICLVGLTAFSAYVLIAPTLGIALVLDLMVLSLAFRFQLLGIVIVNAIACFAFERYAERPIARMIKRVKNWWTGRKQRERRRTTSGKVYKTIEGNMR